MILTIDTESLAAFLAIKWRYNPLRRFESKGGMEPMTEKQEKFVLSLLEKYPGEGKELMVVIMAVGGAGDLDDWTKADAMFLINSLYKPRKRPTCKFTEQENDEFGAALEHEEYLERLPTP